jgi:tRNA(Ile)-lysidine synthase
MGEAVARVVDKVRQFLERHNLTGAGVVAVSGGADSVALLRAMLDAGAGPLVAAHFNHGLRGAESDADEAFVRRLVESLWDRWPIGFASESKPVATVARETGQNLEAVARELRYAWLDYVAGPNGCVATGHTADDQAETVLHRIVRGTGIQGLRGIAAARGKVIRPLLTVTRADVLEYLRELGQPFREDATNADPAFTRNRIRHELLPLLKTFNPQVVDVLGRLARQAEDAVEVLDRDARDLLRAAELPSAGEMRVFDAATLEAAGDARVRGMFRMLWDLAALPSRGMTFDHWQRLVGVVRGDPPSAEFPDGVYVRRVGRVVQLTRRP